MKLRKIAVAVAAVVPLIGFVQPAFAQMSLAPKTLVENVKKNANALANNEAKRLKDNALDLELDGETTFDVVNALPDEFGLLHVRLQQKHHGLKVWGGVIISHLDDKGGVRHTTNRLHKKIHSSTHPVFSEKEALAEAIELFGAKKSLTNTPVSELVIYPVTERKLADKAQGLPLEKIDATMVEDVVQRYALAHHIHLSTMSHEDGHREEDFLIDAHDGTVLKRWNSLQTAAVSGTGNTEYSGPALVALSTNSVAGGYELRDMVRGKTGAGAGLPGLGNNVTLKYVSNSPAITDIFTSSTNSWGDGKRYVPNLSIANYQTAAADVHYGVGAAWDFYKNVFNRDGYDGVGTAVYSVVHDPFNRNSQEQSWRGFNAAWSDDCRCMRFGDALDYNNASVTALDVAGHELTHGLTGKTAKLYYFGESGGLNEATSDIFATMMEFYVKGGGLAAKSATIPNSGGNWTIGEGILSSPLRYMYKPSKSGADFDAWFLDIGGQDVHHSSGPMNRAFYFLAAGATTTGETSSTYLPAGMIGVGNDRAAKIWFRALTVYMTPGSDYVAARQAAIAAAKDLYGAGSAEEKAVWNAFRAINVGAAWSAQVCGKLDSGRELFGGESVLSCNSQYSLRMQADGNLVLYNAANSALWSTATWTYPGAFTVFQADGNLVLYKDDTWQPIYNTGTWSSPGASMAIKDDGNLVITSPNGVPVWYRFAPAEAATVVTSANTNDSVATADVLGAGVTGVKGSLSTFQHRYFSYTIPANKTLTVDFVGSWTVKWYMDVMDSQQNPISSDQSYYSNTRLQRDIVNTTGAPKQVYIHVSRDSFYSATSYPFTVGFKLK